MGDRGYFKGWYFKCSNGTQTVAFIPAYHRTDGKTTASLQIVTERGSCNIPFDRLWYREKPLSVRIGRSVFSEAGISLDVPEAGVKGFLRFQALSPLAYDIMGPFSAVPFMQCRHRVYSMTHRVDGWLRIGGEQLDFSEGVGYMEGDRGCSFPRRYLWTQCCFGKDSLMLSVADIPMPGFHFTGIIGAILWEGREYRLATYRGAGIGHLGHNCVTVRQGAYEFTARLLQQRGQPLRAPLRGSMSKTIHESPSCVAHYRFSHKREILFDFVTDCASFEFEYSDPFASKDSRLRSV